MMSFLRVLTTTTTTSRNGGSVLGMSKGFHWKPASQPLDRVALPWLKIPDIQAPVTNKQWKNVERGGWRKETTFYLILFLLGGRGLGSSSLQTDDEVCKNCFVLIQDYGKEKVKFRTSGSKKIVFKYELPTPSRNYCQVSKPHGIIVNWANLWCGRFCRLISRDNPVNELGCNPLGLGFSRSPGARSQRQDSILEPGNEFWLPL